jgi:putative flippase GtrA
VISRPTIVRMARCLSVSLVTTVLSTSVLVTLAVGFGVRAALANVVAVVVGTVPSYVGNRRFVWRRRGRSDVMREIGPFWLLSFTGLAGSTLAVDAIDAVSRSWSSGARAIALPLANLSVWGVLWLVQFALLDRVIFCDRVPRVARLEPQATSSELAA